MKHFNIYNLNATNHLNNLYAHADEWKQLCATFKGFHER